MCENISEESAQISEWKSTKTYMIALICWTAGLVNVFHTPRQFLRATLLDHLISYLFVMIIMGIPLMQMELAVSQYSQKSVVGSWDLCPLFRGIGYSKSITILLFQIYYNVLNSYFLLYCFSVIPKYDTMDKCDVNLSNASYCFEIYVNGSVEKAKYGSAAEKFWFTEIVNINEEFNTLGEPNWKLVGCLCVTVLFVFIANSKGTRSMRKCLKFIFTVSSIETVIFLYFATITPGSLDGIHNFISAEINFDKMAPWQNNSTTLANFHTILFSLGLGLGGLSSIGAHSTFRTPVHESPVWMNLINFGNSILYPFIMACFYGILRHHSKRDIEEIKYQILQAKSDVSYIFIVIPNALQYLPGHPQVWQVIVYSSIYLRGLCSSILMASTVLQIVYEINPNLIRQSLICSLIFSALICLPGWMLHTNVGMKICTFINDITYTVLLPIINCVQVIAVVYFYHILNLADDLNFMLGFPASTYFQLSLTFTSLLLPIFTVMSLVRYFEETYDAMTIIMQKCTLTIVLVWIPFMIMVRIIRKRRWKNIIKPSTKWAPPEELKESRKMFSEVHSVEEYLYEKNLIKNKLRKYE